MKTNPIENWIAGHISRQEMAKAITGKRKEFGHDIKSLAKKCGISRSHLSGIENNKCGLSHKSARRIAEQLWPLDYLKLGEPQIIEEPKGFVISFNQAMDQQALLLFAAHAPNEIPEWFKHTSIPELPSDVNAERHFFQWRRYFATQMLAHMATVK